MCSFIVKSLKHTLAKFQTNWSNGKCFAAQYQSSLTWSRDAFWANRLPNQSTPKTVLALQHPISLLLVNRFTWNFVWVLFNHLVISIQRFNEFGVKMTVSEPLTWGLFFSGHPVHVTEWATTSEDPRSAQKLGRCPTPTNPLKCATSRRFSW